MREDEIVQASGARVLKSGDRGKDYNFSTDTRTISDELYLPLKGVNFDGENFIEDAIEKGASGYFTTKGVVLNSAQAVFQVDDTLKTYLKLAKFYKNKINPIVIGVTGSSGKTTTKEMLFSVLSKKFKTVKTFSNHNNEIGFCQTVFSMEPDTEVLIVEMGMRGLGEIELISKYAEPDIAIITNSGTSHIGRLGSLENIAKAKCEIAKYLKSEGYFIAKNQDIIKQNVEFNGKQIYFSINDVKILERSVSHTVFEYKDGKYELNVSGDYNIENAISVIEAVRRFGLTNEEINSGLLDYKPIEKRWEVIEVCGNKIINDSYNANPESMKASVKTFLELYKNPVVVLGNMGELGSDEIKYHRDVGKYLAGLNVKNVKYLTVGDLAFEIASELNNNGIFAKSFDNNHDVARYILDNLNVGNTIFLKASRTMKFEEIIEEMRGIKL